MTKLVKVLPMNDAKFTSGRSTFQSNDIVSLPQIRPRSRKIFFIQACRGMTSTTTKVSLVQGWLRDNCNCDTGSWSIKHIGAGMGRGRRRGLCGFNNGRGSSECS